MKLRLTRRAAKNIAEIGDYIRAHNQVAAERVEAEVRSSLRLLREHPLAGRLYEANVRRFPLPNYPYLIFYRVRANVIEIVTIRHAARSPGFD